ncbi:PEP-CTERM sorting domain-containing protein [Hydrogenophaga sp.]|uniref:PEP-CTERM sorting domain-containing protein n=1 Tax=Hydrogenophaga sp. TaxID=1904254 RepID=UPI0025C02537|nr:PEP-CTERM sorting domain-containing protein [Hydrogenophaga sp.]MBT9463069.1 PEP-CTERM sorting domain-containing protein [Hydrogenophaga sp.]
MKLKFIALAAMMAASGAANAAIADSNDNTATSGDLFGSFYSAASSASFTVDLGLRLDQFYAAVAPSALGIKLVWDLDGAGSFTDLSTTLTGLAAQVQAINYGGIFNMFETPAVASASDLVFDVKAMDGFPLSFAGAGANRYLSTSSAASLTASNGQVFAMDNVDAYTTAANADATNSTHGSAAAGANMYDAGDATNVSFQNGSGDNWKGAVSFTSPGSASNPLNFFYLSNTSSTAANAATVTKYAGSWSFDTLQNQLIYSSAAPVPEPETYALLLAGLGLMGTIARRRRQA